MTERDPDQLPDDLAALLASGRPGEDVPESARQSLLASLAPLMGPAGPGGGQPPPQGSHNGPGPAGTAPIAPSPTSVVRTVLGTKAVAWLGGIAVGTVIGAAGHAMLRPPPASTPAPVAVVASQPSRQEAEPPRADSPLPSSTEPPGSQSVAALPSAQPPPSSDSRGTTSPPTDPASRDRALRAERELLDVARTAIARGDGEAALLVVRQHARQYPRGTLAEEREALRIQALLLAGRQDEARSQAEHFRDEHPDSLMLPGIAPALSGSSPRP